MESTDTSTATSQVARDGTGAATAEALEELVAFLRDRAESLGHLLAERYRAEIVEYRSLPQGFIDQDVAPTARRNLEEILATLGGENADPADINLAVFRDSAIRRFQQGVPMQALLHAYRLWGHTLWEEVRRSPVAQEHPEAAMVLAGRIMQHVDLVSTTVAQAYLQRASGLIEDREMARRDFLEAVITGNSPERVASYSTSFGFDESSRLLVMLLRRRAPGTSADAAPRTLREARRLVEETAHEIATPTSLVGIREDEVVALFEVRTGVPEDLRQQADTLAARLPEFIVGVSRPHAGLHGASAAYVDAQDAILSAWTRGDEGPRAHLFADALLDHVIRTSSYRGDIEREVMAPLRDYDDSSGLDLLRTLRTYIDSRFSLAKAASRLHLQANTVKYRLKRVHALTGYDPFSPEDIVLLALALRLPDSR